MSAIFWLMFAATIVALLTYASIKLLDVDPLDRALARLFPQATLRNRLIGGAAVVTAVTVVWAAVRRGTDSSV